MILWLKKNRRKIILIVLALIVLSSAYYYGGNSAGLQGWSASGSGAASGFSASAALPGGQASSSEAAGTGGTASSTGKLPDGKNDAAQQTQKAASTGEKKTVTALEKEAAAAKISQSPAKEEKGDEKYSSSKGMAIDPSTGKDQYQTAPVPDGKPVPVEPQEAVITKQKDTCTISISCSTINDNLDWLDPEKKELVPSDGWILKPTEVTFYQGESVFNVLMRTCKQNGIQMEYKNTPIYNTAYIEGISNLYEFDCGELSGWVYSVGGWFPNYGSSRYQLQDGDTVKWEYTCSLGADVGGYFSSLTN